MWSVFVAADASSNLSSFFVMLISRIYYWGKRQLSEKYSSNFIHYAGTRNKSWRCPKFVYVHCEWAMKYNAFIKYIIIHVYSVFFGGIWLLQIILVRFCLPVALEFFSMWLIAHDGSRARSTQCRVKQLSKCNYQGGTTKTQQPTK